MSIWEIVSSVPWLAPVIILAVLLFALGLYKLIKDWLPW
jgi:uncharacterized membrane protein